MSSFERQLPNPFSEGDNARDKLEQLELEVEELKQNQRLLMQSVTLLMNLCNKKYKSIK